MELIVKSGAATGARTEGVPVIVTTMSLVWAITPLVAVIVSV